MSKEATITKAVLEIEKDRKILAEYGCKELFTTHGWQCLGYITYDKKLPDEATGQRRRWIKGYRFENGSPLSPSEHIFETSLHRFNRKAGELQDIVVHEDDFVVVMERKTFDLSDEDDNFQFVPNMHHLNRIQQLKDNADAASDRIYELLQEKDQSLLDVEHFKREAKTAKESAKSNLELLNRLTRDSSELQERIGNLEAKNQKLRASNLEYESMMDELIANAQEKGTIKGMTTDDQVLHAIEKKKDIQEAMFDLEPGGEDAGQAYQQDELDELKKRLATLERKMSDETKGTQLP